MARTFVGLFDSAAAAQQLVQALGEAGVPQEHIKIVGQQGPPGPETLAPLTDAGMSQAQASGYLDAVRQGRTLVLVSSDDFTMETAYDALRGAGMQDVNQQIAQQQRDLARGDGQTHAGSSETLEPSVGQKWEESNKLGTSIGTVAGALHGAAAGTVLGGPVGGIIGAIAGAAAGGTGGALADATFEAVQQEDTAHQEQAADEAEQEQKGL